MDINLNPKPCRLSLASVAKLAITYGLDMSDILTINPTSETMLSSTWVKALCDAAVYGYTHPGVPDYMLFDDLVIRGIDPYATCSDYPPLACCPEAGTELDFDIDDEDWYDPELGV